MCFVSRLGLHRDHGRTLAETCAGLESLVIVEHEIQSEFSLKIFIMPYKLQLALVKEADGSMQGGLTFPMQSSTTVSYPSPSQAGSSTSLPAPDKAVFFSC